MMSSKRIPNYSLDSVNLKANTLFDFEMMQNHLPLHSAQAALDVNEESGGRKKWSREVRSH